MNKERMMKSVFLAWAVILCLLLSVFFSCDDGGKPIPEGIKGFPATLIMGEPFDLRKNITINLPNAPDKTIDDVIWASNDGGTPYPTTQIVVEDGIFIPITFFTGPVTIYAYVADGNGELPFIEEITTNIVFPLNPFIGTWSGSDGKTWKFNTDGTFDIDSTTNTGSFAVWSGRPGRKFLVTVTGDPETITVQSITATDASKSGNYQPYCFEITGNTIKITPIIFDYTAYNKQDARGFEEDEDGTVITLTRQSGAPAALDLSQNASASMMIGGWVGNFTANSFNFTSDTSVTGVNASGTVTATSPSLTYYADGKVRQNYEGAWLKRGAVFVTVGNDGRRWDPPALAAWSTGKAAAMGNIDVVRIDEYRTGEAGTPYSRGTNTSLYWRLVKFPSP